MPTISGTVYDDAGAPAAGRIVRAYRRDTGALLGSAVTSDGLPIAGDTHYANVSLLLHCDGADNSTVFADSSAAPKTSTANGNAKISTAQSKFGGASAFFDGNGDYLQFAASSAFGFGTDDFTIEVFLFLTGGQGTDRGITDFRYSGGADVGTFFIDGPAGNTLAFWYGSKLGGVGSALSLSVWHHAALCRAEGVSRCFLDGVMQWSSSASINFGASRPLGVGAGVYTGGEGTSPFTGYMDDLRITKGVARYTANFTPPTAPHYDRLPADATPVGSYGITTAYTGEVQRIVLDDDAGTLYNDLIDRVVLA